jgi:hypothetical protein
MKLRILQSVENLNYIFVFSIDTDSLSADDLLRIKKFGAPSINFGGSFDDGDGLTFTLPDQYQDLPSGFPIRKSFSLSDPFDTDSLAKFELYRTTIQSRVTTAITDLRGLSDSFTGEFITNI